MSELWGERPLVGPRSGVSTARRLPTLASLEQEEQRQQQSNQDSTKLKLSPLLHLCYPLLNPLYSSAPLALQDHCVPLFQTILSSLLPHKLTVGTFFVEGLVSNEINKTRSHISNNL